MGLKNSNHIASFAKAVTAYKKSMATGRYTQEPRVVYLATIIMFLIMFIIFLMHSTAILSIRNIIMFITENKNYILH